MFRHGRKERLRARCFLHLAPNSPALYRFFGALPRPTILVLLFIIQRVAIHVSHSACCDDLGLPRREIEQRFRDIVEFSELGQFIDAPVRTYSAGMRGRLGFSIAIHIDPDVLLLDEVLSVGDGAFRAKAGSILDHFRAAHKTVVIATHNMVLVHEVCNKAVWIDGGTIKAAGSPDEVIRAYTGTEPAVATAAGSSHAQSD